MKKWISWIVATVILMIICPWLTVSFAGTNGMAICFILFFSINPLFAITAGVYAGTNIRQFWMIPLITATFFLLGVWIFFEMGEPAFLFYSGIYLLIGTVAMLVTALVRK